MDPQEVAEALRAEVLPGSAVVGRLLDAGEYGAVVLDTIATAAVGQIPISPTLLDAVESAVDEGAFDDVDAGDLTSDLAALRAASAVLR